MVTKMSDPGRLFGGVADYCLHDRWVPGQGHPESAERVEWTETRNLATEQGDRAARIMAATAEASPELKRLAGGAATGRKLEKPVCHYSLNWARDEKPDRQEMLRAAEGSLKALGMERHQALIVSHRDGQPHVHVIANRVDPESGKAAGLSRSKLKLSKWAERYEREQGKIRCPERERNNKAGGGGAGRDGRGHSGGRWRLERMSPQREPREAIPAEREGPERERVAWQRAEERSNGSGFSGGGGGSRETRETEQWEWSGFTDVKSGSGSSWRKTAMECWGAFGLGGSSDRQTARDRRDDPGTHGSAGALSGGVGASATLGAGFVGESAFGSGAGDRKQGGMSLPQLDGRGRGTGASGPLPPGCPALGTRGRLGRGGRGGRGGTDSQCITIIVAKTGTGSSARRRRSGWSRCGRSTESRLTRR